MVVNHALHWSGATGSWESGRRSYTAVYRVWTNSALDGPQQIVAYFYSGVGLPVLGVSYSYGNDADVWAFCTKIDPQRTADGSNQWTVACSFETRDQDQEQGRDKNGNPTDNPLEFYTEIDISKAQFSRPAEKAYNLTALPHRPKDTNGPVVNSAGVVFDPGLERDDTHTVLRITKNQDHFPDSISQSYQDAINSSNWTLWLEFQQFTKTFLMHEGKVQNIGGSFNARVTTNPQNQSQLIRYWKNVYELHFREGGWIDEVLDRGIHAKAEIGDPDGRGNTIGFKSDGSAMDSQEFAAAFPPGTPPVRRLTDAWGQPLDEPVLLDGMGQPLAIGAAPVFLKYRTLKELPFAGLGISDQLP